ncbi:MAG: endolytic transglycosylase MltG [Candidatus Andersenbacteria bacterium]
MRRQLSHARAIEAYRGRRHTGRWTALLFFGALVLTGIVVLSLVMRSANKIKDPKATPKTITIEAGLGTPEIGQKLFEEGLLVSKNAFSAAVVLEGARGKLQAGTYELSAAQSARQMAELLRDGKTKELRVTIPEGLRLDQVADVLQQNHVVSHDDFLRATRQEYSFSFLQSKPGAADLEGFLFPDTYHFAPDVTPEEVVTAMLKNFESKIADLLPQLEASKQSLYQILTLASIVEKEVPGDTDRKLVAGVFTNRLEAGMPLQSDITLAYVLKQDDKTEFSTADTQTEDPYNTYLHTGLPPGPINSPGLSAIQAALAPTGSGYLYFVSNLKTGETLYAKTLEEHQANIQKAGLDE